MKKIILLFIIGFGLLSVTDAQRVRGTVKPSTNVNEVMLAIKPTAGFTGAMTNLALAVQIPISVGPRPTLTVTNLQTSLFGAFTVIDSDQGDGFYTWGFNCAVQGASNTDATVWSTNEIDVLKIAFIGSPVAPFTARMCHYLDGGNSSYAIFYVETTLASVNGGVLSDWGNLFYGIGVTNGAPAAGNIGVPNALYSYVTVPNVSLPTKFVSFFATKANDNANLTWTVDNEENNAYFNVQRSLDGRNFTTIAKVQALRNGKSVNTYTLPDANISALGKKVVYYQIQGFETSGKTLSTEIRSINLDSKNFSAQLYPNPVKAFTKLVVDAPEAGKAFVVIRDASGKTVQQINMEFVKGINQKEINASALAAGDYNVTILSEKFNQTIKMTKSN